MSLLDDRLLKTFIAVAEERHFGRAAERLNLSQPPVSDRIQRLENLLGVQLFVRTTRQVLLTAAGSELLLHALQLVQQAAEIEATIRRFGNSAQTDLHVGFTSTAASSVLPYFLEHYRRQKPEINLHLQEDWSAQLMAMLRQGKLDFAILRRPRSNLSNDTHFTLIEREPLQLVVSTSHRLANRKKVKLSELDGETMVGYSPSTAQYFHGTINDLLTHYRVAPRTTHQSAIPTVLALVKARMGVALVPRSTNRLQSMGLTTIPLHDPDNIGYVELYVATQAGDTRQVVTHAIECLLALGRAP